MVWGLLPLRALRSALASLIGLAAAGAAAPGLAVAKSQAGGTTEVVYYDPLAMTPQAKLASQTRGGSLKGNKLSAIDAYPDNAAVTLRAFSRGAAPRSIANLDQRDFVKIGAPYRQNGVWYVPANEPNYDETGTASWYGADFHGKQTSNGEAFDMNVISAAHPTLPLPSMVEITNLENGRTLKVRVNDRGPFMKGRLIDLSRRGAQELGYYGKGSARVRVRYVGPADADNSSNKFADSPASFHPKGLQATSYRQPLRISAPIRQSELPAPQAPAPFAVNPAPKQERVGGSETIGGRYLQVGAFSSQANAGKLREKFGAVTVKIVQVSQNGSSLYRVMMGPFADDMAMERARATAANLGISSARAVTLN